MVKLIIAVIMAFAAVAFLMVGGVGVALGLENQDAFCASCHTEPELTYYQQSQQQNPTTMAAFHRQKATACIDCHSGSGILGRGEGLQQGAHDLVNYLSGNYHRPAITTDPLGDDSCYKCHQSVLGVTRGGNRSMNGHYHAFLQRWQAVDKSAAHCTDCHPAHASGRESLQFMPQGQVARVCDNCHSALGGQEGGETR